ncbi:MAG: DMT family transporter [Thermoanaerobaculaceae bacterium]|nr:DMT family transporter [Thermoanaerobaculaceae bacterium]
MDFGLLVTILVWGVNYAVIKAALTELQPLVFNAIRFSLATLTLALLVRGRGPAPRISRPDLVRLALLGVLGNTIYQMIFILGIARTTAANASLIMASCPVMVAVLGTALGRDRLPAPAWAGVGLAVAGLALLLASGRGGGLATGNLTGDLLILAAGVTWSAYTVLAGAVMARVPALTATLVTFLSGTPVLVAVAVPALLAQNWGAVGGRGWFGAAFSGVFALGISYVLWNAGLAALGGARTAVYQNFTPVVAAAFAWLTLGERWTPGQFAGAAAVLSGIALTRLRPPPQPRSQPPTAA